MVARGGGATGPHVVRSAKAAGVQKPAEAVALGETGKPLRECALFLVPFRAEVEFAGKPEGLPDSLRDTATDEALEALADLDLTALADIEPPRGYGRD